MYTNGPTVMSSLSCARPRTTETWRQAPNGAAYDQRREPAARVRRAVTAGETVRSVRAYRTGSAPVRTIGRGDAADLPPAIGEVGGLGGRQDAGGPTTNEPTAADPSHAPGRRRRRVVVRRAPPAYGTRDCFYRTRGDVP